MYENTILMIAVFIIHTVIHTHYRHSRSLYTVILLCFSPVSMSHLHHKPSYLSHTEDTDTNAFDTLLISDFRSVLSFEMRTEIWKKPEVSKAVMTFGWFFFRFKSVLHHSQSYPCYPTSVERCNMIASYRRFAAYIYSTAIHASAETATLPLETSRVWSVDVGTAAVTAARALSPMLLSLRSADKLSSLSQSTPTASCNHHPSCTHHHSITTERESTIQKQTWSLGSKSI